jgi:hypothetical protein
MGRKTQFGELPLKSSHMAYRLTESSPGDRFINRDGCIGIGAGEL